MDHRALAQALVDAEAAERAELLVVHRVLATPELAHALKTLYDEAKSSDPQRAAACAAALRAFADHTSDPEAHAYANWVDGMAALQLRGEAEEAIKWLDKAVAGFEGLGEKSLAASVQVSRLHALAILGQYDEAITSGLRSIATLDSHNDALIIGKIEQNIGNIYWRRDQYKEAEALYQAAHSHFTIIADQRELAHAEINLANVQTSLSNFNDARELYERALRRTETLGSNVIQAIIESNLGWLALYQGQYASALEYLEQSRRHYAAMDMPHESAIADLELADAYLELNLIPEAAEICSRVARIFDDLGMKAEQAYTLANYARTNLLLGQLDAASNLIAQAKQLYYDEENNVGIATVALTEAQLYFQQENFAAAYHAAKQAEQAFAATGASGKELNARWLRGESVRAQGRDREAKTLFETVLDRANQQMLPQIAYQCYSSLGLLAREAGDIERAEALMKQAVEVIESLRAPLPGEEFRTAFVADKLTPYAELIRLCLVEGGEDAMIEAWSYVERARSRALVDVLGGSVQYQTSPRDAFEESLLTQLQNLTQQLSWLYTQINRPTLDEMSRSAEEMQHFQNEVREREAQVQELTLQLQQRGGSSATQAQLVSIADVQRDLDGDTVLVEYFNLDDELLAFIITSDGLSVHRNLGSEAETKVLVEQFFFQINALRYGSSQVEAHVAQLQRRVCHYLGKLYDMLLRPIEAELDDRRLVVSPYRTLHYVPFHALYDGEHYIIEQREVVYAPSANVLHHCLSLQQQPIKQAVLLGVADEQAPHVSDELGMLSQIFPSSTVLANEDATLSALQTHAPSADVLHLASHGHFRPDNPLFSALKLHDGWLTVRDAYTLDLRCRLVALSACETGVNGVAPGDELLGLVRGFFAAGSAALLASLWSVDDGATSQLMAEFYARLAAGENLAAALRHAQLHALQQNKHPFYWSPFMLVGRW